MTFRATILFLLISVASAFGQFAIRDQASISGVVRRSDGAPVPNARIELRSIMNGQVSYAGYTSANGAFDFSNLVPGSYELTAVAGLAEARERLELTDMNGFVTLTLPADPNAQVGQGDSVSVAQMMVPRKARDEYKKASDALSKQKAKEAYEHLAKSLEIAPDYAEALTLRGLLKLDARDPQAAAADVEHAIKADPNYPMAYMVLGAIYNQQSRFDEAIQTLNHGLRIQPTSWQGQFELGKAYLGASRFQDAVATLGKAEMYAPESYHLVHLVKAHALLGLNQYGDAMAELQDYLAKEPKGAQSDQARAMLDRVRAFTASSQK